MSVLLDIYERLGVIETKLDHGTERFDRLDNEIAVIKPQVKDLMDFKARIGAMIVVAGALVSGALYLIWQGLSYFSAEIRTAIGRLFH